MLYTCIICGGTVYKLGCIPFLLFVSIIIVYYILFSWSIFTAVFSQLSQNKLCATCFPKHWLHLIFNVVLSFYISCDLYFWYHVMKYITFNNVVVPWITSLMILAHLGNCSELAKNAQKGQRSSNNLFSNCVSLKHSGSQYATKMVNTYL